MNPLELTEQINQLEQVIIKKKAQLAKLRKQVEGVPVSNYVFTRSNGNTIRLTDLFDDKDELLVIHNMGKNCPYCTLWADGFNSLYHHIIEKAAFVLSSPDDPATQDDVAAERGWQFPMVSTANNTFKEDFGFKKKDEYYPGVSVFTKGKDGQVFHHSKTLFGPGDDFCVLTSLFDLLPSGSEFFHPKRKINKNSSFQLTNNVAVQVKDYANAITFYNKIIGMRLDSTTPVESKFSINGRNFYIENADANVGEGKVFFEFAVDDFAAAKKLLVQEGCTITKEYHEKSVMLKDPYGLRYHLFEST
ncbi:DUF899 family protein [Evansella tamaricis]|uniref:DUF899 family protein n=1 Tax=Evansella tamaricis TaxID=2069301 RepID=A0ABS6JDN4_9BACI|nr:DUF899 family protein [Evansella tamaricis]MBU9711779.1 DUF899 family protein [Evansella tamaricis]